MTGFRAMLIDTDVLIDYFKGVSEAVDFIETHIDQVALSAITVAELYQGVRDGKERAALDSFISAVSVFSVTEEIGILAGLFRRQYKPSHGVGLADCLIAATAQGNHTQLITLNTKHFPMLESVSKPYEKN